MAVCILSVSYDPSLLATRQMMLEAAGYRVVSAFGFVEAEKRCKQVGFDLFVLGHSIPRPDKQSLISYFRHVCPAPVVSLLRTGEPLVDGADYHLSPDDPHVLLQEIANILRPRIHEPAA